jgi:putative spermidine/putrescine transport system permease protein
MSRRTRPFLWTWTIVVLLFLVAPIATIMPIAFSSGSFLSYPLPGFSLRWFRLVFEPYPWLFALRNSLIVAAFTVLLAVPLGTIAAFGLRGPHFSGKTVVRLILLSPMVVPVVIVGLAATLALSRIGLQGSFTGMIVMHAALALPFVIVPVSATLKGLDPNFSRAAASLGASPWSVFWSVNLPLVMPGVASGAAFAFITSFDEVVVALFVSSPSTLTLPRQLFSGLRDELTPALVAISFILIVLSCLLMLCVEYLRARTDRRRAQES